MTCRTHGYSPSEAAVVLAARLIHPRGPERRARCRQHAPVAVWCAIAGAVVFPACTTEKYRMTAIDPPRLEMAPGTVSQGGTSSVVQYTESERLPIGEATHVTITDSASNTLYDDRPRANQTYDVPVPKDGKLFVTTHWSGGLPTRQELTHPPQNDGPARVTIRWVEGAQQYTTAGQAILAGEQRRPVTTVPAEVEKIEVLKGPSAAEPGPSATAGAVLQVSRQKKDSGAANTGTSADRSSARVWLVGVGMGYTDRKVAVTGNVPTVTNGIVSLDSTALNLFAEYRQAFGTTFDLGAQRYDPFWFGRVQYNFNDDESATPLEFHAPTPGTDTGAAFENPLTLSAGIGARTKFEGSWGFEGTLGLTLSQQNLEVITNEVGEISRFKNDDLVWGLGLNLGVTKNIPGWPAQFVGKVGVNCMEGMEAAGMTRRGFTYMAETGSDCDGAIAVEMRASLEGMLRRLRGEYEDDDWPF